MVYLYTLSSVIIVSILSLIGVITLAVKPVTLKKITFLLVSLSAGTLLGDSFLHLLPEAIEKNSDLAIWFWLLGGILIFFVLEKIICWRHCHLETTDNHPHPVGTMNLVGDGLHNLIDGIVIAGSFIVSIPLGLTTTIAVIAHEIPQEIGDYRVLIHAGYTRSKALFLNFCSAATSLIGALFILVTSVNSDNFSASIIPFTAGGFIYIATADLIPELKKDTGAIKSFGQLIAIIAGIAIMFGLKFIFE
ncbi:MAG: ZIP family metal transporter [Patescibacteria group bacterium]|nr:ZIP family metal transporter [Patescibacteria group bacterium]